LPCFITAGSGEVAAGFQPPPSRRDPAWVQQQRDAAPKPAVKEPSKTSEWGESPGVRCRVKMPAQVNWAELFLVEIVLDRIPERLPEGVMRNAGQLRHWTWLVLENTTTGDKFELQPEDPFSGMPSEIKPISLREAGEVSKWDRFRVARCKEPAPAGVYRCRVEVRPRWEAGWGQSPMPGEWTEPLKTGEVVVEVLPAEMEKLVIEIPVDLRDYAKGGAKLPEHVEVLFTKGFIVGSYSSVDGEVFGVSSGVKLVGLKEGLYRFKARDGKPRTLGVKVFESCETTMHFWMPEDCGYRLLWEQEFVVPDEDKK